MYDYGIGYCDNGYYAGHDGEGIESEEACKNLCLQEYQCTFVAYKSVTPRTCTRYNGAVCILYNMTQFAKEHNLFVKKGLFITRID